MAFFHDVTYPGTTLGGTDAPESTEFFYIYPTDAVELVKKFEHRKSYAAQYSAMNSISNHMVLAAANRLRQRDEELKYKLHDSITKTRIFLNPLLPEKFEWFSNLFKVRLAEGASRFKYPDVNDKMHDEVARPEASWHRMLISQPPLGALTAEPRVETPRYHFNDIGAGKIGESIRLGALRHAFGQRRSDTVHPKGWAHCEVWSTGADLTKIGKGTAEECRRAEAETARQAEVLRRLNVPRKMGEKSLKVDIVKPMYENGLGSTYSVTL